VFSRAQVSDGSKISTDDVSLCDCFIGHRQIHGGGLGHTLLVVGRECSNVPFYLTAGVPVLKIICFLGF
jgi:hypothetical protein